jgi:hypothetical protein
MSSTLGSGSGRSSESMSREAIRWRLLVSAAEDYEPLFHALWEFGVPADPLPGAPSEDEIKDALWELIEEGLVDLFQGQTPNGEFVPLAADRRRSVFQAADSWRAYEDPKRDVRYSTTAAGDEAVRRPPEGGRG